MISKITGILLTITFLALPMERMTAICLSRLDREVGQLARRGLARDARLGVYAQTRNQQILINHRGDMPLIPASNQKLLTSAIALFYLGADYQIATSLMTELPVANGEIAGNLWVVGRGDPTLSSNQGLKELVAQLKARGVTTIQGEIKFLDALRGRSLSRGWAQRYLHEYYAAPVSAFTLDDNSHYWTITPTKRGQPPKFTWEHPELVQGWRVENRAVTSPPNGSYTLYTERPQGQKLLRIYGTIPENVEPELGGVVIPDQQAYFRERLLAELQAQGITIKQQPVLNLGTATIELAHKLSPPLSEILSFVNKNSNNLYAEQLLRILGNRLPEVYPDDTYIGGIKIIEKFFVDWNIPSYGLEIADGSGLSSANRVTPRMLVGLLQVMAEYPQLRNSLPIAGVDGTLKRRFRNTMAVKQLRGKTGTIAGAVALSGYVQNSEFGEIVFSIMINHPHQSVLEMRRVVDRIALLLVHLRRC
ncbi:MAG: D-alanyl-D-alanine carboxypeptidase/D-alanyl-D-alanine-endopeptidase [Pseudanabaenaceae cyanobacterium]